MVPIEDRVPKSRVAVPPESRDDPWVGGGSLEGRWRGKDGKHGHRENETVEERGEGSVQDRNRHRDGVREKRFKRGRGVEGKELPLDPVSWNFFVGPIPESFKNFFPGLVV